MIVNLAGLRRIMSDLADLPGDTAIDLERLVRRGSTHVYDRALDMHIDVRLDLEDIVDD